MTLVTLTRSALAGQSGLTLDVLSSRQRLPIETGISLSEGATGVFSGTSPTTLSGTLYVLEIRDSGGNLLETVVHRVGPVPPTHDSEHMPDGTADQVLVHNGTEFVATNPEVLSNNVNNDIQGYYGLLTNFYFVGSTPTVTEIDTEEVDTWIDVNFDIDTLGTFDNRPDTMKSAQSVGHAGTGTQADPILLSLEGLTQTASCNFRASLTFEPDVDEAQLETRLLFNRHSGTTPSDDFPIADVSLNMNNGANIEYDAEPMLSFFVGDTIDTNGVGDAGKCRFQVRSTVEGTLRMRALTWYIQS